LREYSRSNRGLGILTLGVLLGVLLGSAPTVAQAQEVWTGPDLAFTKGNFVPWSLPANQDEITANVRFARKDTGPMFNAVVDPGGPSGCGGGAPSDTEWATGSAANWAALTFEPLLPWADCSPTSVIGVNAVLHLISDDIYIDIRFTSWTQGGGGGFGFVRSTETPPTVPAMSGWGAWVLGLALSLTGMGFVASRPPDFVAVAVAAR